MNFSQWHKYNSFFFLQDFYERTFSHIFLHNECHVGVRQRTPWLILHKILNVYTRTNLWIKGCQLFRKFICDVNHHNTFRSGLTYVNELHRHIFIILDNIIVLFFKRLFDILCLMLSFGPHQFLMKVFPCNFFHNPFNVGIRLTIPKLKFHKILDVYPNINFMNKCLSIFQKTHVQCDSQ